MSLIHSKNFKEKKYLNDLLGFHRENCLDKECICVDYQEYLNPLKNVVKQEQIKKNLQDEQNIEELSVDQSSSFNNRGSLSSLFQASIRSRAGDEENKSVFDTFEFIDFGSLKQFSPISPQRQKFIRNQKNKKQLDVQIAQNFIQESYADVNIDDFFKILTNQNQNMDLIQVQESDAQSYLTIFQSRGQNFKSLDEVKEYFYVKIFNATLQQLDSQIKVNKEASQNEYILIRTHYLSIYAKQYYLALFNLLKFSNSKKNMGFFERINFQVAEQFIIKETLTQFESTMDRNNYKDFIETNTKKIYLERLYQESTHKILNLWRNWSQPQCNIQQIMEDGRFISKDIKKLKTLTKELEKMEIYNLDLQKYREYACFQLEILNDPFTYNEMIKYLNNSMQYLRKAQQFKSFDRNNSHFNKQQTQGVAIVKAWGMSSSSWEFLYSNKNFAEIFMMDETSLIGKNINIIMPQRICENHDQFIKRFLKDGQPRVLGKVRPLLGKTNEGYLIPIKFTLHFYYHIRFDYAFITTIEKLDLFNCFGEEQSLIPCEDALFFTTNENFSVLDFSKNVLNSLSISKKEWQNQKEINNQEINMSKIILNFEQIMIQHIGQNYQPPQLSDSIINQLVYIRQFDIISEKFEDRNGFLCMLNYFQMSFYTQSDSINLTVFILLPVFKHPDYDKFCQLNSTLKLNSYMNSFSPKATMISEAKQTKMEFQLIEDSKEKEFNTISVASQSLSGSNSDHEIIKTNYSKNFLFQTKTPRVLKLVIYVLMAIFLIFIVIIFWDLGSFLNSFDGIYNRMKKMKTIGRRNNLLQKAMLDLRILSITTDRSIYIQEETTIFPDDPFRMQTYYQALKDDVQEISEVQQELLNLLHDTKRDDSKQFSFQHISRDCKTYTLNTTSKHTFFLILGTLDSFTIEDLLLDQAPLNVNSYPQLEAKEEDGQCASDIKKNLYFVFQNALFKLYSIATMHSSKLYEESQEQSSTSKNQNRIITFSSLGIVTLFCILLFPLLNNIFDRYKFVIRKYALLSDEVVKQLITKAQLFLLESNGNNIQSGNTHLRTIKDSEQFEEEKSIGSIDEMTLVQVEQKFEKLYKGKKVEPAPSSEFNELVRQQSIKKVFKKNQEKKDAKGKSLSLSPKNYHIDQRHESQEEILAKMDTISKRKNYVDVELFKLHCSFKIKILVMIMILSCTLGSSLLISFQISQNIFNQDVESQQILKSFYDRSECLYDLPLFMAEQYIRNAEVLTQLDGEKQKIVQYFIDKCLTLESTFTEYEKNVPPIIKKENLDSLQDYTMLNKTFQDDPQKLNICSNAINSISIDGMMAINFYIFKFMQAEQFRFIQNPNSANETIRFINSKSFHQLVDYITYCLTPIHWKTQSNIIADTEDFFNSKKNLYIMVVGIYMGLVVILLIGISVVIFRKIKNEMSEITDLFILFPLDQLPAEEKYKIEAFIQQ